MSRAIATTDHQEIRRWVEARNGHPAVVKSTQGGNSASAGLLRIDFDQPEQSLGDVSWDEFFETFDSNQLAFLYQDKTASGRKSRFNKFVNRDAVDTQDTEEGSGRSRQASGQDEVDAEEADEDDALEEDEDFDDDEDEDEEDTR